MFLHLKGRKAQLTVTPEDHTSILCTDGLGQEPWEIVWTEKPVTGNLSAPKDRLINVGEQRECAATMQEGRFPSSFH